MDNLRWLIPDQDYNEAIDILDTALFENGLICEQMAVIQFCIAAFDHDEMCCPNCNTSYAWVDKRGNRCCKNCKTKYRLATRRFLTEKLEITKWWRFCYLVGTMKIINSSTIARDLVVTQKTAWHMLRILREAAKYKGIAIKNGWIEVENNWECMELLMQLKPNLVATEKNQ